MFIFGIFISYLLSGGYIFVESVRNGMAKKRWVTAGFMLGPMILPMFQISKKMALRKSIGFNNRYMFA